MKRHLPTLTEQEYDLLVIGGGIYGACVAWDAALRGLAVALVEKGDFASATSANSLKVIHGGLRYLQHGDLRRMRLSMGERGILMRIAPHLVHPLPVLVPTYGHGRRGKEVFSLALKLNDLISFDRNWQLKDPQKHIPKGLTIGRDECLALLPGINQEKLSGAALFYDAQLYNSERLVLAFVQSAAKKGAVVANYTEVTGFLRKGDHLRGVRVQDCLTSEPFEIRAKIIVNTTGGWMNSLLGLLHGASAEIRFAKAINLVTRPLFTDYAVGVYSQDEYDDKDAIFKKKRRLLFIVPWRTHSLIGTAYMPANSPADELEVTEDEIERFLHQINRAYRGAAGKLKREDVSFVHCGLLPRAGMGQSGSIQLYKQHQIIDHRQEGIHGLLSVVGVKYTTARYVAQKVVDKVFSISGYKPPPCLTMNTPLHGGAIEHLERFVQANSKPNPFGVDEQTMRNLLYQYGSAYGALLKEVDIKEKASLQPWQRLLKAQILYGMRHEMAQTVDDIILRRTDLATAGYPADEIMQFCTEVMG